MIELPTMQRVWSYGRALHYPRPYLDDKGEWRCADCLRRLTSYGYRGTRRLRHYWRES